MNARSGMLIVIGFLACTGLADEAEDHSQDRGEAQQGGQHTEQQQNGAPAQAAEGDPHEQHRREDKDDSRTQADEHAHHRSTQPNAEPTESERAHIPPEAPQRFMGDMPKERMSELMQMEDDALFGMVLLDQLEWREINNAAAQVWEFDAWYGDDYNKLWFETEGDRVDGEEEGRVELMWDRIISPWWSLQTGVRQDFGEGPSRTWFDLGIQGLAPYFFEIDAAVYVGEQGRTAFRFSGEYDMLITQRLILQPELEFRLYGKNDPENGVGSGLSNVEIGARLRYEIRREIAPYLGVHWERKFGRTEDLARDEGEDVNALVFVAGLRAWF
jgi:copper resistance protein B